MKTVESKEYYAECPSCGAPGEGKEVCPYCGTSLLKKETHSYVNSDKSVEEMENDEADRNLPIIQGKNAKLSGFMILFCSIFAGCFGIIGAVMLFMLPVWFFMGMWLFILFPLLFLPIGIGAAYPLFSSLSHQKAVKAAKPVPGVVRGYEEANFTINDRPVLKVKVLLDEAYDPKILMVNTGETVRTFPIGQRVNVRQDGNYYMITAE